MSDAALPRATERLCCRLWVASDLSLAQQLWGDERVTRYVAGPWSEAQISARFERYCGYQGQHGYTYWPWFLAPDGGFVGVCGLKPAPSEVQTAEDRVLETGFYLRPDFHAQGYAAEMARSVIAHAFEVLGCTALWAGCHPDNAASGRLLARLGFTPYGTEFYEPIGMNQPTYLLRRPGMRS